MVLAKIYRNGHEEAIEESRIERLLASRDFRSVNVKVETCFYIQLTENCLLDEELLKKLEGILGDAWDNNYGITETTEITDGKLLPTCLFAEIGPRLSFSTAWSTNCVNVCKSAGLNELERLEKASRYCIEIPSARRSEVLEMLFDPMTQQNYAKPLDSFSENNKILQWSSVDVVGRGRTALEEINRSMGLAFDEWDLDHYTKLFKEKIRRNPTTVELFDLAQSNSEHSRHWFFKGEYEVDGRKLPISLLEMVMNTNIPEITNQNNVIKFSDNSSGILGWTIPVLCSSNPTEASELKVVNRLRHIIFTAETHNFPTGVSPFSGATTGTGGRIRDIQAAGRGGHVIAGTAGYCFGNLHIPGYKLEWETEDIYPRNFAKPLEIVIEASNGASDYGNKFGEPVVCGFSRSFGQIVGENNAERREWIKPIMFSGGIGSLDEKMVHKNPPESNQLVVKIGGPAYRIGVGGGAASSVQVQGDNAASRDLGAVQRGDAEMEQKLNRVIRGCLEMDHNPISSIHDQGAGGNANVLKELMEGAGGVVFTKAFSCGDPTLSTLEIWGAEYQESNAILVNPSCYKRLEELCLRERCPVDKVGFITNDGKVRVFETEFEEKVNLRNETDLPVNLDLHWVLGKMPKKKFKWTKKEISPLKLHIDETENMTPLLALKRVLKLPSVASKRYLTNKVDRSVTGLIAQQQCVGPRQTPIANVAVTALSYFSKEGAATSIGEQPIKLLINPSAGARITVLESLSNLVSCLITDIKDVKCSANWMWPAKLPGEGYYLYEACEAMCDIMKCLGIAVDGGKDSLSMAARIQNPSTQEAQVVKSPGSLVISAYAPCPDIGKIVTPDFKSPLLNKTGTLLLIKPALQQFRVGGSALAQVFAQTGSVSPDLSQEELTIFVSCFHALQTLIKRDKLLSLHDVSDGGLVTCLIEMGIGGWGGFTVTLPLIEDENTLEVSPQFSSLFNEEIGWVVEVEEKDVAEVQSTFNDYGAARAVTFLGHTSSKSASSELLQFTYGKETILCLNLSDAASFWEETSFQLERLQMHPDLASDENSALKSDLPFDYLLNFTWNTKQLSVPQTRHPQTPRMAVIREEGSNGDRELAAAFIQAGFIVHDVTMSDLATLSVNLDQFRGIAFPGGFSYADVLGSGVGWAQSIKLRKAVHSALEEWRNKSTTFSLGICNGCQVMARLRWIGMDEEDTPSVKLDKNSSGRFESRWNRVKIAKSNSLFLKDMENSVLGIWVAHGEGKFIYKSEKVREALKRRGAIALQYVDERQSPTQKYPFNPNGSSDGVAGISSTCGRHLALMPHPERCFLTWQWPFIDPSSRWSSDISPWSKLFQNAFDWSLKSN